MVLATLLRLLLGELTPDTGDVSRGVNVEVAYYDEDWKAARFENQGADPDSNNALIVYIDNPVAQEVVVQFEGFAPEKSIPEACTTKKK